MHTPLLRYHGGKYRLSSWLYGFFPEHRVYVEPFGGAASVLLRKQRSHGEVYNDLDQDVFNLFQVLREHDKATRLIEMCQLTPYSRDEFQLAYEFCEEPVERARRTIVRSAMGFGSGAATGHKTGFRSDASRQYANEAACWHRYPPVLRYVHARLQGVNIENRCALLCMSKNDSPQTLHYVDPPYLPATRKLNTSGSVYRHEMNEGEHETLLAHLQSLQGSVVLSGYDSDLYNDVLVGWYKETRQARVSAGRGTGLRTECVWINSVGQEALRAGSVGKHHTSRSAYLSHRVRSDQSEKAIEVAIEALSQAGKPVSKAAVARIVGLRREHISRRYSHCFV
ncbi:DNA methyltransferase [Vibrio tasmaniensis ZS-17]|uniref:DNA adenine methylase n=1 Tax=Vibrio tasmaniensis TaxID=212663 RepID=UPI0002F07642|nr:DNA adenine methylase [Vibrio tasmaniensis]OED66761.1 DNA methyltransferase [Vibrio tasmaniensis ZS-17]